MQCNGGGVRGARAILEFFEILIPLLLLLSTYYDGFVHSRCIKHSSYTFGKIQSLEKGKEGFRYCAEFKNTY